MSLCREISKICPISVDGSRVKSSKSADPARATFNRWLKELHKRYDPLPPGTFSAIFKLLFPEEDSDRKYNMQEARLGNYIAKILGVSTADGHLGVRLKKWDEVNSVGCLGDEVKRIIAQRGNEVSWFNRG